MNPLTWLIAYFERRFTKRSLARLSTVLVVLLVLSQLFFVWYFGSVGFSMGKTAYSDDDRTVVIEATEIGQLERQYEDHHEVGWCLYGTTNRTHVRITDAVRADPLFAHEDRIGFSCLPETAGQALTGQNPRLVGNVHSHIDQNESRLSRLDVMVLGRVSPVITVMGIYTEQDGVEFFTVESLNEPLEKKIH